MRFEKFYFTSSPKLKNFQNCGDCFRGFSFSSVRRQFQLIIGRGHFIVCLFGRLLADLELVLGGYLPMFAWPKTGPLLRVKSIAHKELQSLKNFCLKEKKLA